MILVIVGTPGPQRDAVLSDLHRVAGQRLQTFCIDYLTDHQARLSRLNLEVAKGMFRNTIKVITGLRTNEEIALMRSKGALITHVYGAMGKIYSHINVVQGDFFVRAPMSSAPRHVLSPEQLISEGEFRLLALVNSASRFCQDKAGR